MIFCDQKNEKKIFLSLKCMASMKNFDWKTFYMSTLQSRIKAQGMTGLCYKKSKLLKRMTLS